VTKDMTMAVAAQTNRLPRAEIKTHNGAPTLFINGAPSAGMTYMTYNPHQRHYEAFGKAGVDLASLSVTADFSVFFGQPTAWLGTDQYDFSDMDKKMQLILEAHPNAYVFPRVYLCSPPWWDDLHPDQLVKWDDGSTERPIGRKKTFPSWASAEYRQASSNNLRHFIEHVTKQWYADRVIGYHIASGMWEEWFYWSSTGASDGLSDLEDYSEPMLQAFHKWLGSKYRNDHSLQEAWQDSTVTLATARIPTKAERQATDCFVWRDPAIRSNVIDYYQFYCENVTEIITLLARTAKEAMNGQLLVGVFYGYMFFSYADNWMQDNGHLALHKLLECKDIDFFTAPSSYAFRPLGVGYTMGQNATDAIRLHGKYYMNENDYCTHLVAHQEEYRRISTLKESEAVQLRELGNMITHAWGGWWFDMGGGWYDEPQFMTMIAKLNEIGERSIHFDRSDSAEMAVVVDEASIFYTGPKKTLMLPIMYNQTLPLGTMGTPFDWVFLDDLDLARPYKVYVFLNAFHVNDRQKKAVKRLRGRGAKALVWLYGAGFAGETSLDVKGCTDLTGIKMEMRAEAGPLLVQMTDEGACTLHCGKADSVYGSKNDIGPLLYPSDPDAAVLGIMQGRGVPGLVLKNIDGVDVYYSAAPTLPGSALRGIAARAGVHVYSDQNDVLYANKSFLSIYAVNAGVRHIRLPRRTDVYDVYNDTTVAKHILTFDVALSAQHTVLYFLGSAAEWKKTT
jgi:beta-galactosidase